MRHRITVRADNLELRGYFDGEVNSLVDFSDAMGPVGMVIASVAPDDYNPFAISQPENPPTIEASRALILDIVQTSSSLVEAVETISHLHYGQAMVIRSERARAEQAEADRG